MKRRIAIRPLPYFVRTEELRSVAEGVLKENGGLTIYALRENLKNFNVPTPKCLAAVLRKDPQKRFKSDNKIWHILKSQPLYLYLPQES